jgi:lambda family phage portal protein
MGLLSWLRGESSPKPKQNIARRTFQAWGGGYDLGGGGSGYLAASQSRRQSRSGSILGPNLLTLAAWQQLIRHSRDAIRNSPIAASAIQKWQSNMVGTGIQPHFAHPDPDIRAAIQKAWDRWVKQADFNGQLSFYGLQTLLAAQLFEAGECFCRYHVVDEDNTYFQLQLIESEQVPVYYTGQVKFPETSTANKTDDLRMGIIFDSATDRRKGYQLYKRQPYDVLGFSGDSLGFIQVGVEDMIHVMKPSRPGDLRGTPHLSSVLMLLEDVEGYADAERLRKRLSACFAFYITKTNVEDQMLPVDNNVPSNDPGTAVTALEPGSAQVLLPGESIIAPEVPQSGDFVAFMNNQLHQFAAGVGLTYEALTGDMKGVNYSSARVALLEFRRGVEQYQQQILIDGFADKVMRRWMKEAVLSGNLDLPADYAQDPESYEQCDWVADGFEYVNPKDEVDATQTAIRDGLTSRSREIRKRGLDPATVDAEIAFERAREKQLGIITDTNANEVLIGRETQPAIITPPDPNAETDEEVDAEGDE